MSNIPKISIITVTYNSEKLLERAVQSVINQGYENLEYIVVDGGSNDGTLDIVKKYDGKGINKWISESDNGIGDAFNKGIRMATGEIVGIINSDDGLEPNALQALADAYKPDIDVYRGKVLLWKEDSGTKIEEIPSMHITTDGMSKISHQSTFIRKDAYVEAVVEGLKTERKDTSEEMKKAGFDINTEAKKLEKMYFDLMENRDANI